LILKRSHLDDNSSITISAGLLRKKIYLFRLYCTIIFHQHKNKFPMKPTLLILLTLVTATIQAQSFKRTDKSPMDMAYFPDNFAHDRKPGDEAIARATYSRPAKNDREVFGKLVPYGEVWRCGANESTEIKFYRDVTVQGKKISAGSYSLFAIPGEKEWTIIFNSDVDYWGAYKYNATHDVARSTATVSKTQESVENFAIRFEKNGDQGGVMKLAWDTTVAELPFTY
jgi:hypothetical protein